MQQGQYILDRWMVAALRDICREKNISFDSYSDDWLIELSDRSNRHRIIGYKFDLNTSVASTIAGDKVAAYQMLQKSNIPAVEHRLIRTKAGDYPDWKNGLSKIVVKPLDGTSGHGVALLENTAKVDAYITSRPTIAAWAVSAYQEIKTERRLIILDGQVICSYEKIPVNINDLAMFNLGLGAIPSVNEAPAETIELAVRATSEIGLRLAAVDVIAVNDTYKILEVNDGIMMENFMRHSDQYKQIGFQTYRHIVDAQFASTS